MIVRVLEGRAYQAPLALECRPLLLDPGKAGQQVRLEMGRAHFSISDGGFFLPRLVELEDASDARQPLAVDGKFGDCGLPESTTRVKPAGDLDTLAAIVLWIEPRGRQLGPIGEEEIEDALGVGLHIAAEAPEPGVDGGAGFVLEVVEQDVISVDDLDEECPFFQGCRVRSFGMGCTQMPVASVAIQNAVARACWRMA